MEDLKVKQRVGRKAIAARLAGAMAILIMSASSAAAAGPAELKRYEYTHVEMGMPFKVLLYADTEQAAKQAAGAAFARIGELNRIMSDYDPESELSRLSRGSPTAEPVQVSASLCKVLLRAHQLALESDGAFDVTVGPYVRLWRRARRNKEFPSQTLLDQARAAVGYRYLELDPASRTVSLKKPHMRLDLGGIAVGYAIDEGLKILRKHGITRAMIDGSGDIGAADPPPGEAGWRIGIVAHDPTGPPCCYLRLANAAVTNSGSAMQHVVLDGREYSHIVDPRTGVGLTDRSSVTVYAKDCITADSLATAVNVLGPVKGLKLIERKAGAAALIVRHTDGKREKFISRAWRTLGCAPR